MLSEFASNGSNGHGCALVFVVMGKGNCRSIDDSWPDYVSSSRSGHKRKRSSHSTRLSPNLRYESPAYLFLILLPPPSFYRTFPNIQNKSDKID